MGVFFFRIPLLSDLPAVTFTVYYHSHPRGEMETPTPKYSPENTVHPTEFPIQFRKQIQDVVLYCAKSRMYIKKRQCGHCRFPISNVAQKSPTCKCGMTVYCVTRYLFTPLPPLLLTPATLNVVHCCPSFRVQKRGEGRGDEEGNGGLER